MATLRFSSVKIGEKIVRFLYYRQPDRVYVTPLKDGDDVPLFVGSDVLAASSQLPKNYCRLHSRYAKDGLATKVTFRGLKIEGIKHSANLWFYTVQGLFAAAFEHLDINAQRDCLLKLKDVWVSSSHRTSKVPKEMAVSLLGEDIEVSFETVPYLVAVPPADKRKPVTDNNSADYQVDAPEIPLHSESHGHTKESPKANMVTNVCKKVREVIDDSIKRHSGEQHSLSVLKTTLELFALDALNERCCNFLSQFLCAYRAFLTGTQEQSSVNCDKFDALLRAASTSLGGVFHEFKEAIGDKVELFKLQNINQIDSLPSAKEIVQTLFPQCMQDFMVAWMCGPDTDKNQENSASVARDHDYSPLAKKARRNSLSAANDSVENTNQENERQSPNIFPFIQLILEFANNVLISGVAHVLYSRLLHSS